jgi:hypothetical protein
MQARDRAQGNSVFSHLLKPKRLKPKRDREDRRDALHPVEQAGDNMAVDDLSGGVAVTKKNVFSLARSVPTKAWAVVGLMLALAVYTASRKTANRVHPAAPQEQEDGHEFLAEERERQHEELLEHAVRLKSKIDRLHGDIQTNATEARTNHLNYQKLFSSNGDPDEEEGIESAFMLKSDADQKKEGMTALGKELAERDSYLRGDLQGAMTELARVQRDLEQFAF